MTGLPPLLSVTFALILTACQWPVPEGPLGDGGDASTDGALDASDLDGALDAPIDAPDASTITSGANFSRRFGDYALDSMEGIAASSTSFVFTGAFRYNADFGGGVVTADGNGDIIVARWAPNEAWRWHRVFGGAGSVNDVGTDVAVGPNEDVYFSATWRGTVDFGSGPVVGDPARQDLAFGRLAAGNGQSIWVRTLVSNATKYINAVAVDSLGNAVVVGQTYDVLDFGGGNVTTVGQSMFVAKYAAADGAYIWASVFESSTGCVANEIAVADNGDVVVVGRFSGSINFGSGPIPAVGLHDIAVVRLRSTDGAVVWAKTLGSSDWDEAFGVAIAEDDVFVGGFISGNVDLGGTVLQGLGARDALLMKLSFDNGDRRWAVALGGTGTDEIASVSIGVDGNPLIAGRFTGTATFGATPITSLGDYDGYAASVRRSDGQGLSSIRFGGSMADASLSVASDRGTKLYVAGTFAGSSVAFPGATQLTSNNGSVDMFVTRFGL